MTAQQNRTPTNHISVPSFGFVAPFASGKSTYARELCEVLQNELLVQVYRPQSFSKAIADIARKEYDAQDEGDGKPNRYLLEQISIRAKQRHGAAVWAYPVITDILENRAESFIADGFREYAEVRAFKSTFRNFYTIRINTNHERRMQAFFETYGHSPTVEELSHPTEISVARIMADIELFNAYDPEARREQLLGIADAVRKGDLSGLLRKN